jgi:hypothetical protein
VSAETDREAARARMRLLRASPGGRNRDRARSYATAALIAAHREEFAALYADALARLERTAS